jgi:hypothetical protein
VLDNILIPQVSKSARRRHPAETGTDRGFPPFRDIFFTTEALTSKRSGVDSPGHPELLVCCPAADDSAQHPTAVNPSTDFFTKHQSRMPIDR